MKLLLRTSVPHDCLDRDQRFSWCNVSLRLRTLSKKIHEQLSPCVLLFSKFITNDVSLAIHCFVNFWIFRFFLWFKDPSIFLFLSTVTRDAITNKNINSTILIFKHHNSLTLNMNKCVLKCLS